MNPLKGLVGLVAIVAIFMVAFYAYSSLSRNSNFSLQPPQTATIADATNNNSFDSEKVALSPSTTKPSQPSLEGFKEKELREGLDNIKAGLDLLKNPFD